MKPKCITAVRLAAGREVTDAEIQRIDTDMDRIARELAKQDPEAWRSLSQGERVMATSNALQAEMTAMADRNVYLANLQVLATGKTEARIADQQKLSAMKVTRSQAQIRDMMNVNNYVHSLHDDAISGMTDMLDAAASTDKTGLLRNIGIKIFDMDNPMMTADVVREIFRNADGFTGNKVAQTAAKAWLSTTESLRQRFNAAGGDIGKLGYGYLTQIHDAVKISKVTAQEWAAKVLPLLDRQQYLRADGSVMSNDEVTAILEASHETLASNGLNKIEPGQYLGTGKRANAGSESRVIHFKDGDAWIAYMQEFGEGSLYSAMLGHIGAMTRNIGLVESYGPNPNQQFRLQNDVSMRADKTGASKDGSMPRRSFLNTPQAYWDILSGKTSSPENDVIAKGFQDVRNVQTAAKLGGAVVSSITDVGTIAATLKYNRLPYFDMLSNVAKRIKPGSEESDFLTSHGIISEHLTTTLNRWTGDNMTHSLTGRVAASVMKLQLMNAWTDGLRGAFSATMMQSFAKKVGTAWSQLDEWDRWLMARKGITESDWNVISQAQPTERGDLKYLTRDSIVSTGAPEANKIATKWMAFVSDEAQFAVVNPDMATRAIVTGGGMPAGTLRGEAARTFFQFKSFPISMLTRHWNRVFDTPQGLEGAPAGFGAKTATGAAVNKLAVLAAMNVTLMMLGATALQIKAMLSGKDPYNMTLGKFWVRALGQGGGLGFIGDYLTKDPTEQRSGSIEQGVGSLAGPAFGSIAGLVGDLIWTNGWEAAEGKKSNAAAEALKWGNSQLPYTNLWYLRGLWEHEFLNQAQEAVNPGYLGRVQSRAAKDWGQEYYWAPDDRLPDRPPDLSKAVQ